ncbi:MAG: hypothetical protein HON23_02110 [Rickettsiales bacterium]|jgi:hypothetical protein|nr:hypothetical protein [Rickettsiales bacterium]
MSANHLTTEQAREYLVDAFLAKQSYEDLKVGDLIGNEQVGYWEVYDRSKANFNGYTAYAFKNETLAQAENISEIKIATRGTNSLLDIFIPDLAIGLDIVPSFQLNSALEFTKSVAIQAGLDSPSPTPSWEIARGTGLLTSP